VSIELSDRRRFGACASFKVSAPATAGAGNLDLLGGTSGEKYVVPSANGSIVGLSVYRFGGDGPTAGLLTLTATVNTAGTTATVPILAAAPTSNTARFVPAQIPFSAGQPLGIDWSTDESWDGTGNYVATLFFEMEV